MAQLAKTPKEAIEDALLAVNANIQQLVVTQGMLEDQLRLLNSTPSKPEADPLATMGGPKVEGCAHLHCEERQTMGTTWYLCHDCREMVDESEVEV